MGQALSLREAGRVSLIDATSVRGPGSVGTVFGGAVYHNFYATRFTGVNDQELLDSAVRASDAEAAWAEAVGRYLGDGGP